MRTSRRTGCIYGRYPNMTRKGWAGSLLRGLRWLLGRQSSIKGGIESYNDAALVVQERPQQRVEEVEPEGNMESYGGPALVVESRSPVPSHKRAPRPAP